MNLLRAFGHILLNEYKALENMGLIKNIALFSQLLMMREVEIVYWAALNTPEDIQEVIKENSQKDGRES